MSKRVSVFSIDVGIDGCFYVCVDSVRVSCPFKDKATCRDFCMAVERSFTRLESRYSLMDYRLSISPVETSSGVGVGGA